MNRNKWYKSITALFLSLFLISLLCPWETATFPNMSEKNLLKAIEKQNEEVIKLLFGGVDDYASSEPMVIRLSEMIKKEHPESVERFEQLNQLINKEYEWKFKKEYGYEDNSHNGPIYGVVSWLVGEWLTGDAPDNCELQQLVREKYGLNAAENQECKYSFGLKKYSQEMGYVFDAMKEATEKTLREKGITELTLLRGVRLEDKINGNDEKLKLRPLSSFTLSTKIVKNFVSPQEGKYSYILVKKFPIERILSFGLTGIGTKGEKEFVVLGATDEVDQFQVIPIME